MQLVALGTSEFAAVCIEAALECDIEIAGLISLPEDLRPNNALNLTHFAARHNIPYFEVEDINSASSIELLRSLRADLLFVSWPKLLKQDAIAAAQLCIGTHPTALPKHRGRHPLHWTIASGLKESALSFFVIDEGVDSGNILLQVPFGVSDSDDINSLAARVNDCGKEGTKLLLRLLSEQPEYRGTPQDHSQATYWRKRTPLDVVIDPQQQSLEVDRIIRSFTLPYPCAKLIFEHSVIPIVRSDILTESSPEIVSLNCGAIFEVSPQSITIKVFDGLMRLHAAVPIPSGLKAGELIHSPAFYLAQSREELLALLAR